MRFLDILEREDGCLSLPRMAAVIGFIVACIMMVAELFGFEAKHLPEFLLFVSSLFGFCYGSKHLDIKMGGGKPNAH